MRTAISLIAVLSLIGCSGSEEPTTVAPPPIAPGTPSRASVWGMVVDESGACIAGGMAEIVGGQAVGQKITQDPHCDAWAYSGGFTFTGLTPGVALTIRASAPGYVDEQRTVGPQGGVIEVFELRKR